MPSYAQQVAETPCFNCGERQLEWVRKWPTRVADPGDEYDPSGYIRCRACGERNESLWSASHRLRGPLWYRGLVMLAHIPVGLAAILALIFGSVIVWILVILSPITVGVPWLLRRAKIIPPRP